MDIAKMLALPLKSLTSSSRIIRKKYGNTDTGTYLRKLVFLRDS